MCIIICICFYFLFQGSTIPNQDHTTLLDYDIIDDNNYDDEILKTLTNDDYLNIPNNNFAIKLSKQMPKDTIFSPLSITFMLSLLNENEIKSLLNYEYSNSDLKMLHHTFNNETIKMANVIVINNKFKVNNKYINSIKNITLVENSNFNDKNLIVNNVNDFIVKNTNGLIKNVLKQSEISNDTSLILVNTIYFKSNWLYKFNPKHTTTYKFGKTKKSVQMMYTKEKYKYYENDELQLLEMYYEDKDYVMGILLSQDTTSLPKISMDDLNDYINNLRKEKVMVYLPKFTHRKRTNLIPLLKNLGVKDIFNDNANLTIAENSHVSSMIHEAVVIVDESGTEASAVTMTVCTENCASPKEKQSYVFKADHPFIYYIRHVPSNMVLFYGNFCNL
jgi:serine protease inhibitor